MPRLRRHVRPGCLIHIIVRFVNREYLLQEPDERLEYLRRTRIAFLRSDWRALAFALMSTHTHLAAIAGHQPFADLSRPLHAGFVGWLNGRRGRLGAAIANRPATYEVPLDQCARLLAYQHNNPVRAGVVAAAGDSDWTSHRHYTGSVESDWLDVDLGLELAGFGSTPSGRQAFAEYVDSQATDDWKISADDLAGVRCRARRALGSSVELGQPRQGEQFAVPLWAPPAAQLQAAEPVSAHLIARVVAEACAVDPEALTSGGRGRALSRARRLFVLVARLYVGASLTEAAAFLAVSIQAASKHARAAGADDHAAAREIALALGIRVP